MTTRIRLLAIALITVIATAPVTFGASAATETEGYFDLSDGTSLRYTLLLPDGEGPFPTVLQYSGYNNGNNAYDGTFGKMVDQVLDAGIAVIGVNLRGSGCSEGTFVPFSPQWAKDGVEVVEWIADQEWSDGNVAMAGVSYPAIMSLVTAVEQPPSLKAIMASVPITDLYRDVGYPGGIFNQTFASVWTVLQKYGTFFAQQEIAEGDSHCATVIAGQNDPTEITGVKAAESPYIDSLPRYTEFLRPEDLASIEVPALVYSAWQDEQLGSRAMYGFEHLNPSRRWVVGSNGDHITFAGSEWYRELGVEFLSHFLRGGAPEDFDRPHVQIANEVRKGDGTFDVLTTSGTFPVPTRETTLYGQADGSFALSSPTEPATLSYNYPQPAPSVPVGIDIGIGVNPEFYNESYKAPVPPGGALTWTTPALAEDVQFHGPGSIDLWLESTADDVDLQVTLTEVRPDGNELYVQRGWLRASHRELDETKSLTTRPWQTHLEADTEPLLSDGPTPLRVEMWPVNHVFRAGSSLRLYIEAPVGFTGFRQLDYLDTPAMNTVHVGPDTPLAFTFGRLPAAADMGDHAPCDTLLNQPCRPNPEPAPGGTMSLSGSAAPPPDSGAAGSGRDGGALPDTGGSLALAGLGALAAAATTRKRGA